MAKKGNQAIEENFVADYSHQVSALCQLVIRNEEKCEKLFEKIVENETWKFYLKNVTKQQAMKDQAQLIRYISERRTEKGFDLFKYVYDSLTDKDEDEFSYWKFFDIWQAILCVKDTDETVRIDRVIFLFSKKSKIKNSIKIQ